MASFEERCGKWRAVVRRTGYKPQSKTFATKTKAKEWARQIEVQMDNAEFLVANSVKDTAREVFLRFRDEVCPDRRGGKWEATRIGRFAAQPWMNKPINKILKSDIEAWKNEMLLTKSPGTVRRELSLMSKVFSHAKKVWHMPVVNPVREITRPADSEARERRPTAFELAQLANHFEGKPMWVVMHLAIETAMRLGEITSLTWSQVHLEERYIQLVKTKNGDKRKVPLSREAVRILQGVLKPVIAEYRARGYHPNKEKLFSFSAASAGVYWREACKKLKIEDLHFHDLRHEAITRLTPKFTNIMELSAVTGHRDMKCLRRYYNPKMTYLADRMDA